MDEQMKQAVELLLSTVTETKTFVLDQAPDVCQQMITYQITMNAVFLGLALVFSAVFYYFSKTVREDDVTWRDAAMIISFGTAAGLYYAFLIQLPTTVQAIVAPKVFLLEKIPQLF